LLGVINSRLATFYALKKGIIRYQKGKQPQIRTNDLELLPIKKPSEYHHQSVIQLVDKILLLNKRLTDIGEKRTDERANIEGEIKKIDNKINELVYEIYEVTEDKEIIENSLK